MRRREDWHERGSGKDRLLVGTKVGEPRMGEFWLFCTKKGTLQHPTEQEMEFHSQPILGKGAWCN